MTSRSVILTMALGAGLLLAGLPSVARAGDPPGRPAGKDPSSAAAPEARALRRAEIFRILRGGSATLDLRLAEHLWRVAGSLAQSDWRPPRVTVRVVVVERAPASADADATNYR